MAGRTAKTAQAAKSKAKTSKAKTKSRATPKRAPKKVASAKTKTAAKKAPKKVAKKAAVKKAAKKPATKKPAAKKTTAKKRAPQKRAPQKRAVDRAVSAQRKIQKAPKAHLSAFDAKLLSELDDLAKVIRDAKREIRQIRPDEVKEEHLPKATDELDAVVAATADATNTIMDACEVIEGVMGAVDAEVAGKLMDATTAIYEACTFQDITGQRITKVVSTMKHIEERIDVLVEALGGPSKGKRKAATKKTAKKTATPKGEKTKVSDEDLLEGPQLGDKAKSQAEIDDLLASFD